jgi:hypothetical protein
MNLVLPVFLDIPFMCNYFVNIRDRTYPEISAPSQLKGLVKKRCYITKQNFGERGVCSQVRISQHYTMAWLHSHCNIVTYHISHTVLPSTGQQFTTGTKPFLQFLFQLPSCLVKNFSCNCKKA